jgi:predicted  nucleic acid-binding Zn-ribbon protein
MSLWDNVQNYFKSIISPLGSTVLQAGANIAAPTVAKQAPQAIPALEATAQKAIKTALPTTTATPSQDLLLAASEPVAKAISYGVNRPLATLGLVSDPSSPLYEQNKYGKGFQLSDIVDAYNRTEQVSPFQAATKSPLFQNSVFGQLADNLLDKYGNVNLDKVNLWDNQDIKNNFVDNKIGRIFTGTGDFILSNAAFGGMAGLAKVAGTKALKSTNLTFSIKSEEDLAKMNDLANQHIMHTQTNGVQGAKTVFGADVQQLADTQDINLILDKVADYSNNERLPSLIQKTTNPYVVKDLLLADKGFTPSMLSLAKTAPSDLWELGDMNAFIKGNVTASGKLPSFDANTLKTVVSAFDDSIAKNPAFKELYDAFLTPEGNVKALGNEFKPVDPSLFADKIGATRTKLAEYKAAAKTRDFSNVGGVMMTPIGNGKYSPITQLVRFVGTKKPLGYVTFSGLRPWDGIEELNAVFDDMRLFSKGDNKIVTGYKEVAGKFEPVTKTAAEYRTEVMNEFVNATSPGERAAVLDKLDDNLAHHLVQSYGLVADKGQVNSFIADAKGLIQKTHSNLSADGFAFDANGHRMVVDPITQRQLADSTAMLPWGKLERDILTVLKEKQLKGKGLITEQVPALLHSIFEAANKAFSFSVLGRPAYIPKNSVMEPLTASMLSMGKVYLEDTVGTVASNAINNNKNRFLGIVKKTTKKSELDAVAKAVEDGHDSLNQAIQIRDNAYAEFENALNTKNLSPATKAEHLDTIKANLRQAENLVQKLEVELDTAVKPFGKLPDVPSVYSLRRRIDFLKSQPNGTGRFSSEIRTAEIALQKAVGNINTLSPNLIEQNKAIEAAWKSIDRVVENNKLATKEQGELLSSLEKYKVRTYGQQGKRTVNIGKQKIEIDSIFDPNKFGSAIRSEFSNATTQEMNFLGELRVGSKFGMLARKGPSGTVDINSPLYFEELAYVVNRHMRGDKLADLVLGGATRDDILKWANSEGLDYVKAIRPISTRSDITNLVDDTIGFVRRYLPDDAIRKLALTKEVTSADLQKVLADKLDILSPIHPTDVDYSGPGSAATAGNIKAVNDSVNQVLGAAWKKMAAAENPIRWIWADKRSVQIIENKLNLLAKQGVVIDDAAVNAVRQAADREALIDAEKTFYTLNRYNRALYAARTVAAFPAASASAMYRFGRLAIKNPGRSAGFMRNYYGFYDTFGVDKNGNPVDNPKDAAYVVIPGTREMGINQGQGVQLSARTFGFLVNMPGPSWLSTMALGSLLNGRPDNAQTAKHIIDNTIGLIPGMKYEDMYPTGINQNAVNPFVPSWARDLSRYFAGDEADTDYYNTFKAVHNYNMTLWEMKLGPKPTIKLDEKMTRQWFLDRALWKFGSPIGMTPKANKPGQIFNDYASALMKKYNGNMDQVQAEMQQVLGPVFPVNRYMYKGSTKSAYVSPTYEGYDRIWKDNKGLVKELAGIDVKTIGLLTSDLAGDPDPQVLKFLSSKTTQLPDGTVLNAKPLTVEEYETQLNINDVWNTYRTEKAKLLEQVRKVENNPKARIADNPDAKAAWDNYLNQLFDYNKDWAIDYKQNSTTDTSFTYAQAMNTIVNNKKFMDSQNKNKNDFFQQMKTFISYRDELVKTYKEAPKGSKTAVQQAWTTYLQEDSAGLWNPQLQQIIDRYFINDKLTETVNK